MELETIGDALDEGLLLVGPGGILTYGNEKARLLLGISETIVGQHLDAAGNYQLRQIVSAATESGVTQLRELRGVERNTAVQARAWNIGEDIVILLRDETRLRHLENVRRDFVASVSHELRTPITAVKLIVDTLRNGALEDRVAAAEFVQSIALEVDHLAAMVEELLELSRIEDPQERSLNPEAVSVAELVQAVRRLQPLLDARGQTLEVNVAREVPAMHGDRMLLEQLLRNLVHNAIKYSPQGACVTLNIAGAEGGKVVIRVVDTGIGIDAEDIPRIFERFWKGDRSRRREGGEGSGLGLAIARHIVDAHGGTITVDSEVRRGSTFSVTLPSAPDKPKSD